MFNNPFFTCENDYDFFLNDFNGLEREMYLQWKQFMLKRAQKRKKKEKTTTTDLKTQPASVRLPPNRKVSYVSSGLSFNNNTTSSKTFSKSNILDTLNKNNLCMFC